MRCIVTSVQRIFCVFSSLREKYSVLFVLNSFTATFFRKYLFIKFLVREQLKEYVTDLIKLLHGYEFEFSVEVLASGTDIRAGQPHE